MSGFASCARPDVRIVKLSETTGATSMPKVHFVNFEDQWKRSSARTVIWVIIRRRL